MDEQSLETQQDLSTPGSAGGEPPVAAPPPVQSAPGTPRPLVERIFRGPNEIRAGWRLAIFVALLVAIGFVLLIATGPVVKRLNLVGAFGATLVGELMAFLSALLASLVMGRIEKRSLADYGLPGRGAFGREFWLGLAWGFLALTSLLVMIHLGHGFDFGGIVLSGRKLAGYAAFWGLTFLVVGFAEEYIFRGYALATLATGMRFWPSALLLSAIFGAIHLGNPGEDWAGGLAAGAIGLFFCLTLRRTGSLWFAIGLHAAWDFSESFIYSVPDSGAMVPGHLTSSAFHGPVWLTGGSVGPEGSALVFVVIGALFLIFNALYRDVRFRPEIMTPQTQAPTTVVESLGTR
jgi:membrane protease YdiL (CAAX protease family)